MSEEIRDRLASSVGGALLKEIADLDSDESRYGFSLFLYEERKDGTGGTTITGSLPVEDCADVIRKILVEHEQGPGLHATITPLEDFDFDD